MPWAGAALLAGCSWVIGTLPEPADDRAGSGADGGAGGIPASDGGSAGDLSAGGSDAGGSATDGRAGAPASGGFTAGDAGKPSTGGQAGEPPGAAGTAGSGADAGDDAGGRAGTATGGAGTATGGAGMATGGAGAATGGAGGCDLCDCDGDGALSVDCDGDDCNDDDAKVKPGQSEYFLDASPGHGFDFDCSTTIEYERPIELTCNALGCDEVTQAFIGTPTCGTADAAWGRCQAQPLVGCSATVLSYQPVRCH